MLKVSLFINYESLMDSEYIINIFGIPRVVYDNLFEKIGSDLIINRKFLILPEPKTESQYDQANCLSSNGFDIIPVIYSNRTTNVTMACKILSTDYDIGVIIPSNIELLPAISQARQNGKQILLCGLSEKIDQIYKNMPFEHGALDFDILYLDSYIDIITDNIIDNVSVGKVLEEIKNEFFDGNIDYNNINIKKYITYWSVRGRYLASNKERTEDEDQMTAKKMMDKLNELSSQYQPGYIKFLNKKWHPESWEREIKVIPKIW